MNKYSNKNPDYTPNDIGNPDLHYRECELLSDAEYFDLLEKQVEANLF